MNRITASLIAIAVLATPAAALAESKQPTVKVPAAALTAPGGQQVIAQKIAQAAETWCRARPADKTIDACRKNLVAELTAAAEAKVELAAKNNQQRMAAK